MTITFLRSAAPFGYAYSAGDTAEFEEALALEFIERGIAIAAEEETKKEVNPNDEGQAETAVKKAIEPKPQGLKRL
jgi:hypothetical protein